MPAGTCSVLTGGAALLQPPRRADRGVPGERQFGGRGEDVRGGGAGARVPAGRRKSFRCNPIRWRSAAGRRGPPRLASTTPRGLPKSPSASVNTRSTVTSKAMRRCYVRRRGAARRWRGSGGAALVGAHRVEHRDPGVDRAGEAVLADAGRAAGCAAGPGRRRRARWSR